MVDSVKNAISRIETPKAQKADSPSDKGAKGSISAQPRAAAASSDSVQLKSAEIASSAKEMAAAAPVDMNNVNRITGLQAMVLKPKDKAYESSLLDKEKRYYRVPINVRTQLMYDRLAEAERLLYGN